MFNVDDCFDLPVLYSSLSNQLHNLSHGKVGKVMENHEILKATKSTVETLSKFDALNYYVSSDT